MARLRMGCGNYPRPRERTDLWCIRCCSNRMVRDSITSARLLDRYLTLHSRRWVFYIAAAVTGCMFIMLLFIRESRPSHLLVQKFAALRKETGCHWLHILNPDSTPSFSSFASVALWRPIRLFFTEPILFMVSVTSSISWALIYLFTTTVPVTFSSLGFSESQTSLAFVPMGFGVCLGILPRLWDVRRLHRRRQNGQAIEPEMKLAGFALAAPSLVIGLWWFSWTNPPAVKFRHQWVVSMLSLVLVGFAANEINYTLSGYLADTYTVYSASAFASLAFLRALMSGTFPLFGHALFSRLGTNVAGSIVAAIATIFCVAAAVVLLYFGKTLRERSPLAGRSLEMHLNTTVEDESVLGTRPYRDRDHDPLQTSLRHDPNAPVFRDKTMHQYCCGQLLPAD